MDITTLDSGYVLFACYCDEEEIPEVIDEAKAYCKENELTSEQVRIVHGSKKENEKMWYFVLVKKR